MAGAGIEVKLDGEYEKIIDALKRASLPALFEVAHAGGLELQKIAKDSFQKKANPVTGAKWDELKHPERKKKNKDRILYLHGSLFRSIIFNAYSDGSMVLGSNLVYARIHQMGGDAGRGRKARIPPRPFMGVPDGFERQFFDDPAIQAALGIGE